MACSLGRYWCRMTMPKGPLCVYLHMKRSQRASRVFLDGALVLGVVVLVSGCGLQRRVELDTASGADESLDNRFGLTDDAQDPSERDKELGYGRWRAKPEPTGTDSPTSPKRRGSSWTGGSPR